MQGNTLGYIVRLFFKNCRLGNAIYTDLCLNSECGGIYLEWMICLKKLNIFNIFNILEVLNQADFQVSNSEIL